MRLKTLALCLMAGFGTSAVAQDNTQTLQQALKQMPQAVLSNTEAIQVSFMDVQAWLGLQNGAPTADAMRRLSIAQSIRPLESAGYGLEQWSANAKVSFDEISYFAGFGQAPAAISYWGLKDKQALNTLLGNLKETGFAAVQADVPGVLANGGPDQMDMSKANPKDPWRGMMGKASFVLPLDTALAQATSAAGMKALAQTSPSVADSDVVAATLTGLQKTLPAEGRIVQAAVISHVMGLGAIDPAKVLSSATGDINVARKNLEAAAAAKARGIPPYFSGILADAQINKQPAVLISLSYADCAAARQAVDGIEAAWKESMAEAVAAEVAGKTVEAGKLCAAVVTLTATQAGNAGNPILAQIMDRYMRRDLSLLQIGVPR